MPGTIARLNAALSWDLDDFDRGTAHIEGVFGRLRGMIAGVAAAFESAGRRMTLGITAPLLGLAGYTIKAASDANELQSAFDYTFGAMSDRMNKWAEDTGDAMGRATDEMQQGAMAFGQLFKVAAPTAEAAAKMSQRFAELAQDASSFYNVPFDVAMEKIRSGLTGEAEPMRDFGVFLSDAAVKAQALKIGLIEEGQELNENGKIMARAALIAAGLNDAKGDVERTSGSLANRIRALQSEIHELAEEMGERLVPIAEKVVGWLKSAIERFKELPEWVKDAAVNMAIFAAVMGPVVLIVTKLAMIALPALLLSATALSGPFNLILPLLSALISPMGTAIVLIGKLAGDFGGLGTILLRVAPLFLRFAGPIGAAIALFLLFKDNVADALRSIGDMAQQTLGPKLEQLFSRLGEIVDTVTRGFEKFAASPVGQAIGTLIELFGRLIEVILELGGSAIVSAIGSLLDLINSVLDVTMRLAAIAKLVLMGEWRSAWALAADTVQNAVARMAESVASLIPGLGVVIQLMQMAGLIQGRSMPNAGDKAGNGGIEADIAKIRAKEAARGKGIGRKYTSEELLALGPIDDPAGNFAGSGDYALPESPPKTKTGRARGRSGPSPEELAARREEIRLQQELDVAREKGDSDAERRLQRQLDLRDREQDYVRAGLSITMARAAAERDISEMDEARAVAQAKAIASDERQFDMKLAELRGDYAHIRALEDEEFIEREIERLKSRGVALAEAEREAQQSLVVLEAARADQAARRLADQRAAHEIDLARLRGDSDSAIRAMEEANRIRQDAQGYEADGMRREDAIGRATSESLDRERAQLTGTFRDTFRDGLRAALDGNLGDFFENWMKERSFNALAKVLDRLATNLADFIFNSRQGGNGGGGGGGGFLGGLLGIGKSILGGGGGGSDITVTRGNASLIGFDTGGSFKINGFPGIDTNTLSLNGNPIARVSQGEIMNVQKGGSAPAGVVHNYFSGNVMTPEFWAEIRAGDIVAESNGARGGAALARQAGLWGLR
ncbi:hypothetical protein [Novosphingobium album (ex Liu et al. 2023)]|uniref:Phage tail tape measure protein n=1 Tax=Novosphingobium album (ex Liu et al. 2023) TaxID=3031130 RepID=A0ABT5WPB0_9SPHN|nr:hypothetical protein [Novosphingobium album (ex Liu et al. 2023)]MDE8651870.1 hypothetical protein [Novosphingobium album (ex Liu et al. 2023)]